MGRLLAAVVMLAALAALAVPVAGAAIPTEKKLAPLQKQVTALTKQVKFLRGELDANYSGDACIAAAIADALQQTWLFVGTFPATSTAPALTEKSYSCSNIRVARQLPTAGSAPTRTTFQAILGWIG